MTQAQKDALSTARVRMTIPLDILTEAAVGELHELAKRPDDIAATDERVKLEALLAHIEHERAQGQEELPIVVYLDRTEP